MTTPERDLCDFEYFIILKRGIFGGLMLCILAMIVNNIHFFFKGSFVSLDLNGGTESYSAMNKHTVVVSWSDTVPGIWCSFVNL